MAEQVFRGRTEDAAAPFLGADFWTDGDFIEGVVDRVFEVEGRRCYALILNAPIALEDVDVTAVSLDSSAGLKMALQAAGLQSLEVNDKVLVRCTGKTPSKKAGNSPRTDFEVEVRRAKAAF
jgi:hypothetical protein